MRSESSFATATEDKRETRERERKRERGRWLRGGEVSVERRRRKESEMKADFRGSQSPVNTREGKRTSIPARGLLRLCFAKRPSVGLPSLTLGTTIGVAARVIPKEPLACAFPIGRGSPFKVVASAANVCFASCADNSARSGATRSAKQHPSGRLRRCPSGSAYSQNRARKSAAIERGTFSVD